MSKDTDPDVSLSDGRTSPSTDFQAQRPDGESGPVDEEGPPPSLPVRVLSGVKDSVTRTYTTVDDRLPIPFIGAVGVVIVYVALLTTIGVVVTPFHAFGFLSLTAGVLFLTILYHPDGEVAPETPVQEYFYPAAGVSFILVGLRYLLMGVVFKVPFS